MKLAAALTALSLAACTTAGNDANLYGSAFGQRVAGNDRYVSVSNVWSESDALPLAAKHCAGFGKTARFNHMEQYRAIFDCEA